MKKTLLILTLFMAINWSFSQGTDILSAEQFCSGNSQLTFNNVYGGTDFTPVGCLGSIPNASYFYMVIDQPGDLYFNIDQEDLFGNPIDVDFIAWGPFTDINDANTNISYTDCATCPNNTTDPTFYPYAADTITDCSFDIAPTELMTILNALPGQVYVVLITNYDSDEGIINFQQSGGGGTTTCLSLPVCGNVYIDAGGTTNNYAGDETTTITPYFAGGTVTVDFTVVDIPDTGDVLTVYNGPDNSYPVLGTVSGLPAIFTSSVAGNPTGAITFEFISDNDGNVGTGWEADITCDPPPAPPSCGETFYDNGGAGGNYVANESQVANIFPDTPGDIITVTFTAFNTESGNDVLTVYDGPNTTYPLIGTYSGSTIPGPFTSTDYSGALTFVFTSNNSIQSSGWAADITCFTPPTCGNTFYDSGGPSGDYISNELETSTFFPDTPGDVVTATFTAFYTEFIDDLYVYNGPDDSYPLIGVFSGTTIPGPFTSTDASGALTFMFDSDGSVEYSGWEANLTCSTPVCGSTVYDSGGAGGNYAANETTTTTYYPDTAGYLVTTTFTAFNTQNSTDILTIYDGPDATYPLLGAFSGTTIPGAFTSSDLTTGALTFVFTSNGSIQNSGWSADITCVPLPDCGSTFYDSGGSTGNYSPSELETTTFFPDFPGDAVVATFTAFNIENGYDDLYVYDGPDDTYPLIGIFTGSAIPGPFTSTNPSGALTFVFDSDGSYQLSGWAANITCFTPICGTTVYDNGGSSGNYIANASETTTYYPDAAGDLININFTEFNTENGTDELSIYDGPDATYPLLGTFSGTTIPGSFTSSDLTTGALTFVFTSNGSVQNSGWAADITCVPPPACGNTYYDSGGSSGNYSANELETNTFFPDYPGDVVVVTFTAFNIEDGYDDLYVYDGPDDTYPLIGIFTGSVIPGPFTSTDPSGALTFVFDSDGSYQLSGWAADISCESSCNLIIADTIYPIGADDCSLNYVELTTNAPIPAAINTLFSENFNGGTFPTGWTTANGGVSADWIISNTSYAGGTTNEAMLDWISGSDIATWSLTSPQINITGETNIQLSFKHDLWQFGIDFTLFIETSTDGTNWVTQYTHANPPDFNQTRNVDISSVDGNTILYIRYRFTGDTGDLFRWSIDDIVITADGIASPPEVTWAPISGLFTDATLTTPYVASTYAGTVFAAPNGVQVYTATNSIGCTDTVTTTYLKKIWNGSVDDNWYVANNWTPSGVPTIDNCIEIPDNALVPNYPITDKFQTPPPIPPLPAQARNVTLLDGAYIEIETNTELIIQEWLDVQGSAIFNLKSSASLIQIEDTATNTGNIHMQRSPNFDGSAIAGSEYVYWSSPVDNFQVNAISPGSAQLYYWQATVAGNGVGNHGNWYGASGTMEDGAGYIVKGLAGTPTTIPTTAYAVPNNTALFSGVPKNGVLTRQIFHGGYNGGPYAGVGNTATNEDDNWNLIGNPYPSAISANAFTNLNTNINGTVYLWDHNGAAVSAIDPFYENYVYNYDDNDYIEHNNTGSNPPGINDLFIASGQAFFVLMNNSASSGSNVTFNNSMRQAIPNYNNNVFSRNSETEESQNYNEKHRIWFDLLSPNNVTNSILVGYVHNATNSFDRLYDGYDFSSGDNSGFYSILDNEGLSIQGRALPFSEEDTVPLGIIANETGSHTITINTVDGLFLNETQNIYIEDTALNIIHDIRISPYQFIIDAGVHNDRFILRYTNNNLSIKDLDTISGIKVFEENDQMVVTSEHSTIASIDVYDILGRTLFYNRSINLDRYQISEISPKNATLLLRIKLVNGQQKIAKVIF